MRKHDFLKHRKTIHPARSRPSSLLLTLELLTSLSQLDFIFLWDKPVHALAQYQEANILYFPSPNAVHRPFTLVTK